MLPISALPAGSETPIGSGSVTLLILYVAIALVASFLCSAAEAVLLTSRVSYIERMIAEKHKFGPIMKKFKEKIDEPLIAILTLNTVAHTAGAAGAGSEATKIFGSASVGIVSAILTLLILIGTEIIPKTLGAKYWKALIPPVAAFIKAIQILLFPLTRPLLAFTGKLSGKDNQPTITRSEIAILASIGQGEGELTESERKIMHNLLTLRNVQAKEIMTPRTVVFAIQRDTTTGEVIQNQRIVPYSRIPIYEEDLDDISGFVLRSDIFRAAAEDKLDVPLHSFVRPLHAVPISISCTEALQEFTARQEHMFLVLDEHGGTSGLLTLEDVIESLIGTEITDESDIVADLRDLAQRRYKRRLQSLGLEEDSSEPGESS